MWGSLDIIPFLALYPEIHFRFFKFFPGILYKKEPEVIFDAPSRLEPDEDLPLFLIINDFNLFKVELLEVSVTISQIGNNIELFKFNELEKYEIKNNFSSRQKSFIFPIPKENVPYGNFYLNAMLTLKKGKKIIKILNDNINTSSKLALLCYRARASLPGKKEGLCIYGDLHFHTQYSQSHVEFGPPLNVIDYICKSSGLSFIGLTDHSYDLSCSMENYLKEDNYLERWKNLTAEVNEKKYHTIFLLGEEISCENSKKEIVHLIVLNNSKFIPGSSDGARRNVIFKKAKKIKEIIDIVHEQNGIVFAAHPCSPCSLLERLLLNRGNWSEEDFKTDLDGIQFFNSGFDNAWEKGKNLWIKLLNKGYKIPLLAGNDAHGDFNRYRAIKLPFVSIYENYKRFMGYGKTAIYGNCKSREDLISKIKGSKIFISTGPYISINFSPDPFDVLVSREKVSQVPEKIFLHLISNEEFGSIKKICLFEGVNEVSFLEKKVFEKSFNETIFEALLTVENNFSKKYIRAEVETQGKNGEKFAAFTSYCFFE